jgi:hypothetical protein
MARPGLEPGTLRFSVVGQPALTRSAERSEKWPFAGVFGTPSAVVASRAVHRDTCGYVRIPVGLCRDAGVGGTNPAVGSSGYGVRSLTSSVAGRTSEIYATAKNEAVVIPSRIGEAVLPQRGDTGGEGRTCKESVGIGRVPAGVGSQSLGESSRGR